MTKAGIFREIPISQRSQPRLEMARLTRQGASPPEAYVFGNEVGAQVTFPKKAWETTASRRTVTRRSGSGQGQATAACRARLQAIDLDFHDLRHEGGSRLLEAGCPLDYVRDMLGHVDISTTSRYPNAEREGPRDRCVGRTKPPPLQNRWKRRPEEAAERARLEPRQA